MLLFEMGCVAGPPTAGALAGRLGLEAVFLLAAGLALATAIVRPGADQHGRDRDEC